ncbi:hypothetical protein ABPG77_002451 [Micractinium sp. CCAP 211/92]
MSGQGAPCQHSCFISSRLSEGADHLSSSEFGHWQLRQGRKVQMAKQPSSYLVQVAGPTPANGEDKPAAGPVYRAAIAKDGPPAIPYQSLYEMFQASVQKFPNNNCLGRREGAGYSWLTYKQTSDQVADIGSALVKAGLQPHGRVGVYGANSPEWMIAMQACNRQNLYCVPLYDSLGEHAIEYIVNHSETTCVFTQSEKFGTLANSLPHVNGLVKTVVYWGPGDAVAAEAAKAAGAAVYSFEEFLQLGKASPAPPSPPKPQDLCTIMYTSGTTGDPKGVELTHENVMAAIISLQTFVTQTGMGLDDSDVFLSFLPLAHIFDRSSLRRCTSNCLPSCCRLPTPPALPRGRACRRLPTLPRPALRPRPSPPPLPTLPRPALRPCSPPRPPQGVQLGAHDAACFHPVAACLPEIAGTHQMQRAGVLTMCTCRSCPSLHLRRVALPAAVTWPKACPAPQLSLSAPSVGPAQAAPCCVPAPTAPPPCWRLLAAYCLIAHPLLSSGSNKMLAQHEAVGSAASLASCKACGAPQPCSPSSAATPAAQQQLLHQQHQLACTQASPAGACHATRRALASSACVAGRGNHPPRRGGHRRLAERFPGGAQSAPGPHRQPDRLPATGPHL